MKIMRFVFLSMVVFVLTITSCGKNTYTDKFDTAIAKLDYTASAMYIKIGSLSELMEKAKPNLIIRCKISSRSDSEIMDFSGKRNNADLTSSLLNSESKIRIAAEFLSTPYDIDIEEIYLGEDVTEKDSITLYTTYGILGEYYRRDGMYPILKVGQEYLMFLRVDYMYGQKVYYPAFKPVSMLELSGDGKFSGEYQEYINGIFGDYKGSTDALLSDLKELIAKNDYDLTMDSFRLPVNSVN